LASIPGAGSLAPALFARQDRCNADRVSRPATHQTALGA
jgi:hypothetical protein